MARITATTTTTAFVAPQHFATAVLTHPSSHPTILSHVLPIFRSIHLPPRSSPPPTKPPSTTRSLTFLTLQIHFLLQSSYFSLLPTTTILVCHAVELILNATKTVTTSPASVRASIQATAQATIQTPIHAAIRRATYATIRVVTRANVPVRAASVKSHVTRKH